MPAVEREPYRHSEGVRRQVHRLAVELHFCAGNSLVAAPGHDAVGMGLDVAGVKYQPFIIMVYPSPIPAARPDSTGPASGRSGGGSFIIPVVRGQIPPGGAVRKIQKAQR